MKDNYFNLYETILIFNVKNYLIFESHY
jgi:hypothetical protein